MTGGPSVDKEDPRSKWLSVSKRGSVHRFETRASEPDTSNSDMNWAGIKTVLVYVFMTGSWLELDNTFILRFWRMRSIQSWRVFQRTVAFMRSPNYCELWVGYAIHRIEGGNSCAEKSYDVNWHNLCYELSVIQLLGLDIEASSFAITRGICGAIISSSFVVDLSVRRHNPDWNHKPSLWNQTRANLRLFLVLLLE